MSTLEKVAIGAHLRTAEGQGGGFGKSGGSVFTSSLRLDRVDEARLLREAAFQLERVGLGELIHVDAGSLALGQQRILEIARTLCADPALILLGEPAAGLRYKEKKALTELLASCAARA